MSYRFIYCNPERERVIPAVLIDRRATLPAISGQVGTVIKAYTDARFNEVNTENTLTYKIETEDGNLVGYWSIHLRDAFGAAFLGYQLRPAFVQFDSIISAEIINFINNGGYRPDALV